jgi:hypothetical protein
MSWYWTVLLVLVAFILLSSPIDQRLRNLTISKSRARTIYTANSKVSNLDQTMVLGIIASSMVAGAAPQIAIKSGLSFLPHQAQSIYLTKLDGIKTNTDPDFLMKNIDFILQSVDNGNQVANVLLNKIAIFQSNHKLNLQTRIKKAEIWILAPLGLCFLPTFVLLTIIPLLASMLGNFFN